MEKLRYKQYCKIRDEQGLFMNSEIERFMYEHFEFELRRGKELKSKFDKFSYDEKLLFFEKLYDEPHLVNTMQIIPDSLVERHNDIILERSITIYPKNDSEAEKHIEWTVKTKLTKLIKNFHSSIIKKQRQTEKEDYIKSKLEIITKQKDKATMPSGTFAGTFNEYFDRGYKMRLHEIGFNYAYETYFKLIANELHRNTFIDGMVCYKFEYFLKEELHKIQKESSIENESEVNENLQQGSTLIWNAESNTLVDLFYQLKRFPVQNNESLISNSNEEIANFLKNNFTCFENTKISTILGQLKKKERPKKRRLFIQLK